MSDEAKTTATDECRREVRAMCEGPANAACDVDKTTDPHAELRRLSHPLMGWYHGAEVRALLAERDKLRRGWLMTIQVENSCVANGVGCRAKWCGCVAEMEMLANE